MNINTSVSGIRNAFLRQDVSADNVANINTDNYQAKDVINQSMENGGVEGIVTTSSAPASTNNNNVSLAKEMVSQINNIDQEKANINVLETQNEMLGSLIDLKT